LVLPAKYINGTFCFEQQMMLSTEPLGVSIFGLPKQLNNSSKHKRARSCLKRNGNSKSKYQDLGMFHDTRENVTFLMMEGEEGW
jgi:hypothetical protein